MKKEAKISKTLASTQALIAKIAAKSHLVKDIANHLDYGVDFIQDRYCNRNFFTEMLF